MSDFFKKLNVLVRASLNDVLSDARQPLASHRLGNDVEHEIGALRQRINEALDYEDSLMQRVQQLQSEVNRLDEQVDKTVEQGADETARRLLVDLERNQQRLAMAESDLKAHRLVTQELITRVNELDAAVADARRAQGPAAEAPDAPLEQASRVVSDVLREMRDKIAEMRDMADLSVPDAAVDEPPIDEDKLEDDLAQRRNRLSKK